MELGLKGKVVVITGGGTGIGKAAAFEFLREGSRVTVIGRRTAPLEEAAKEAAAEGLTLSYDSVDVTSREAVEAFVTALAEKEGSIDVWLNNAGIGINKPFFTFTPEDWNRILSINLEAVFNCTQIVARVMKKQHSGVIVNASSFTSKIPHADGVLYGATKAAVSSLTRSTAAALAPYGIRVVGYVPGMIVTPISAEEVAKYGDKYTRDISMQRLGTPEDLAKPIVFLASDAAQYITGTELEVSGGKFAVQDCKLAWTLAENEE